MSRYEEGDILRDGEIVALPGDDDVVRVGRVYGLPISGVIPDLLWEVQIVSGEDRLDVTVGELRRATDKQQALFAAHNPEVTDDAYRRDLVAARNAAAAKARESIEGGAPGAVDWVLLTERLHALCAEASS